MVVMSAASSRSERPVVARVDPPWSSFEDPHADDARGASVMR
jgi:hypothetical protein